MVYHPKKYPFLVYTKILILCLIGILGTMYISPYFMVVVLLYWMQYTIILSYLQYKKKSKHDYDSITKILLNYTIRSVLFIALAMAGILSFIFYGTVTMGITSLFLWFIFASNFFYYYTKKWFPVIVYSIVMILVYILVRRVIVPDVLFFL